MLRTILTVLQVISAFAIVGLVLLQRGKGADAGAGFGAGASGTVFGARGATTGLSRMTAVFAAIFMLNSLCLTYLFQRDARTEPTSLLDKVPVSTTAPAPAAPAQTAPKPAPAADANAVPVPPEPVEQPVKKP
jgi:preprotein translocase subunit SecG